MERATAFPWSAADSENRQRADVFYRFPPVIQIVVLFLPRSLLFFQGLGAVAVQLKGQGREGGKEVVNQGFGNWSGRRFDRGQGKMQIAMMMTMISIRGMGKW